MGARDVLTDIWQRNYIGDRDRQAHKFPARDTCDTMAPNLFNLAMKNRPFATLVSLVVLLFLFTWCLSSGRYPRPHRAMTYDPRILDLLPTVSPFSRARDGRENGERKKKIAEFSGGRVISVPWILLVLLESSRDLFRSNVAQ